MQPTHRVQRTHAKHAAHPASATDSPLATEPAVATLRTVPALPAVATLATVPALPAVATLRAVPALPAVAALHAVAALASVPTLRWVAALANVPALRSVAALANVPALRSVAALANVPALRSVAALANVPALTLRSISARPDVPSSGAVSSLRGGSESGTIRTVGFRPMQINGNGALVAGGASGLGEATARRLHAAGARVLIADLNEERGAALAAELGEPAAFLRTDVTDSGAVQAAVGAAAEQGGLRISVCCAGIGWAERIASKRGPHRLEPFETLIRINLIGTFNVLRLAAATMVPAEPTSSGERGVCINTASIAAFDGQIGQVSYAASKGGIVGLTLPAARDLASAGIRVCTIAPGTFDTPLLAALPEQSREALGRAVPFPSRLGRPDEFAALAVHIVENEMLNGEVIRLDGALRMPPR